MLLKYVKTAQPTPLFTSELQRQRTEFLRDYAEAQTKYPIGAYLVHNFSERILKVIGHHDTPFSCSKDRFNTYRVLKVVGLDGREWLPQSVNEVRQNVATQGITSKAC